MKKATMNAWMKRSLFTTVSAALCFFLYFSSYNGQPSALTDSSSWISTSLANPSPDVAIADEPQANFSYTPGRPPKITVIAIWAIKSNNTPVYIPLFFQSVEANPQVNLLFVQVDVLGYGCPTYSDAPNVKSLCFSEREYWELHVEFMCRRWNCTQADRSILLHRMMDKGKKDRNNSHFRILRNGIFREWIDPATTIWGWCDIDTYWGNFKRTFPWEIAHQFDVIAISSQPHFQDQRLLFLRGHMSFFRHSPEVLELMHSYPKFDSLAAYLTLPDTSKDAEESEFSHYVFSDEKALTFAVVEGMVESYDTILVSDQGTFYLNQHKQKDMTPEIRKRLVPLVRPPSDKAAVTPIFTADVTEKDARVYEDCTDYTGFRWFPKENCTYVETGWSPKERVDKAYFMRHEPYGQIVQRLESRERYLSRDGKLIVDECLYKHWQDEKNKDWFKGLPSGDLRPGQLLVSYDHSQVEIWDLNGDIIYEAAS